MGAHPGGRLSLLLPFLMGDNPSEDVDILPAEGLVHAAHRAELAAHGAAVLMLRGPVRPDGPGGLLLAPT